MLKLIDKLLDKVTMYRLTVYVLIGLDLIAIWLCFIGKLHFSAIGLIESIIAITITCYIVNKVMAYIFNVPTNTESYLITALILSLIIPPFNGGDGQNFTFLLAASGLAMGSKYVLSYRGSHIFNPAAIAVVLTALGPRQAADWWVGTTVMLPFVLIGGILLVRKIRRGRMVSVFFVTALIASVVYSALSKVSITSDLHQTLTSSALFFLGFVMLTEPISSPKTDKMRYAYAALVGLIFPPQFHLYTLYATPELALIAGNIFSFIVSPKTKLFLNIKQKIRTTPDSVDFVFSTPSGLKFKPGQYMEWTLPHKKTDSRGNRRYFTIASSPTEEDLRIGVKFYEKSSSFKEALLDMPRESVVMVDQLAGDFTLPKDKSKKLVLIAGGIGITPYRSMLKYLIDKSEARDIILIYSARTKEDLAYTKVLEEARTKLGISVNYVITGGPKIAAEPNTHHGRINLEMINKLIPDYRTRTFYISGTQSMVKSISSLLSGLGVYSHQIKTDYFSGYSS